MKKSSTVRPARINASLDADAAKKQRYAQPLQTTSDPAWHWPTFFSVWFYHIFLPWSLPIHYMCEGSTAHNVRGFSPLWSAPNMIFHIITPGFFWAIPVLYVLFMDECEAHGVS